MRGEYLQREIIDFWNIRAFMRFLRFLFTYMNATIPLRDDLCRFCCISFPFVSFVFYCLEKSIDYGWPGKKGGRNLSTSFCVCLSSSTTLTPFPASASFCFFVS